MYIGTGLGDEILYLPDLHRFMHLSNDWMLYKHDLHDLHIVWHCARCLDLILTLPAQISVPFQIIDCYINMTYSVHIFWGCVMCWNVILVLLDLHRFMHLSNDWMLYKHDLHIVWHCARCLDLIVTLPAQISVPFQMIWEMIIKLISQLL